MLQIPDTGDLHFLDFTFKNLPDRQVCECMCE